MTDEEIAALVATWLPHWADKKLDGQLELYAQLNTRDGRRMGNAVIVDVVEEDRLSKYLKDLAPLYVIQTDFGHTLRLTTRELESAFYPPVWRMKEGRVKRHMEYMTGYVDFDRELADEA